MQSMWTAFMVVVLIVLFILLIKFLFYNCVLLRPGDDSTPIIPGRREAFWIEYDRIRMQGVMARQPPPDFDDAIRNSRPVSYLGVDEEPPPTYDDFLKSCSPSPTSTLTSPLSEGVNFSPVEEQEGGTFGLNPFENDFIIHLQETRGDDGDTAAASLVERVYGTQFKNDVKCDSDNNQSEA